MGASVSISGRVAIDTSGQMRSKLVDALRSKPDVIAGIRLAREKTGKGESRFEAQAVKESVELAHDSYDFSAAALMRLRK
ncbi:MAG: hypothetical protein JOY95_03090 [Silvibacterium sp.]|nr:hypothetical protein [Silvibacterium sp.]